MPRFKANKYSGTGNGSIDVTTTSRTYFGREPQYGTLRVTADGVRYSTVSLVMKGAKEFITLSSPDTVVDEQRLAVISGTANVKNLTIAGAGIQVVGATINGTSVTGKWDGNTLVAIPDDPGASDAFAFNITVRLSGDSSTAILSSGTGVTKSIYVRASSSEVVAEEIVLGNFSAGTSITSREYKGTMDITANVPWKISSESSQWLNILPLSGGGNNVLIITVPENTGRASRNAVVEAVKYNDPTADVRDSSTIHQDGKDVFLKFVTSSMEKSIDDVDDGGYIHLVFYGKTNGYRFDSLTFSNSVGVVPEFESITAGNDETFDDSDTFPLVFNEGYGLGEEYNFVLKIKVAMEAGATGGSGTFILTGGIPGNTDSVAGSYTIKASGEEYLTVSGDTSGVITLPANTASGSTVSTNITVNTNVDWEIISQE